MSSVVPLRRDTVSEAQTLGELIRFADGLHEDEIIDRAIYELEEIKRQRALGGNAIARHLVVTGVLCNRAVFELLGVKKLNSFRMNRANSLAKVAKAVVAAMPIGAVLCCVWVEVVGLVDADRFLLVPWL